MANLKNILIKSLRNADINNALENVSNAQQNLLKNYSNPVFNSNDKKKLLNKYSTLENIGKSLYRLNYINDDTEKQNLSDTVLKSGISNTKYVWHSENSEHTCQKCRELDGTVYDFADEVPERPHPNCKCYVEIVEDDEPCDCEEQINEILNDAAELEIEANEIIAEIEKMVSEIDVDIQKYRQLYAMALSLKQDVENMEPCGEKCIAITGFAIDLTNDDYLEQMYYNLIKNSREARETYELFTYNKKLMIEEHEHSDKYYHAKANCESARLGVIQALWAILHSIMKELKDYVNKVFIQHRDAKEIFLDCMEDLNADMMGLFKALEHGCCKENVIEVEQSFQTNKL